MSALTDHWYLFFRQCEDKLIRRNAELMLAEVKLDIATKALEFYADKENWDDDEYLPTIWDDGDLDFGKRAREALEKIK